MTRALPALIALTLIAGCHARSSEPKVTHAWVRLPAVAGQPAAAYFTMDGGSSAKRLTRMESALAQRIEIHASMKGMGGMTTMAPLPAVDLPAGGAVIFAPGGMHAMIFGLESVVTPGTAVPLRFGFADGTTAEAEAKTVSAGEGAPY